MELVTALHCDHITLTKAGISPLSGEDEDCVYLRAGLGPVCMT